MSQFFDQASLVMVPSGYKNGKVYSQKPLSTDGELTFTRSNDTATRVNSSGLIEKVRTSLFTYNTDFTNVAWQKQSTTAVADQVANPVNGAVDADLFYPNASGTYRAIRRNLSPLVISEVGISIYAKAAGKSILFFNDSSGTRQVAFDLSAGTFVNTSATLISMEALSGGWYRCSFSANTEMLYMCVSDGTGNSSVTANGTDGIYIWGQQTEYGVPTEFIGVTTSAAVSVGPVANLPRLDYSGGATCPSLLLEPQRTNSVRFSEQMDNAAWLKLAGVSISANQSVSPDGNTNADHITWSTSGSSTQLYQVNSTSGTSQVLSLFIKYISGSGTGFRLSVGSAVNFGLNLEFSNGGTTLTGTKGTNVSSYKIEDYGNNWFRVSLVPVYAGANTEYNLFRYSGTGTDVYAIWGAQLESASATYATSYIPTLSAAVTRGADASYKTGISSLFGSAFTIFIDVLKLEDNGPTRYLVVKGSGGTYENWIAFEKVSEGVSLIITDGSGNNQVYINKPNIAVGQRLKIAARCQNGSYAFYINGEQIGISSAAFTPSVSIFDLHYYDYLGNQKYNQAMILQPLTNAQLAELTT